MWKNPCSVRAKEVKRKAKLKYRRTKNGLLMGDYFSIKQRCMGKVKNTAHLYSGLPFLDRDIFIKWSLACPKFNLLYKEWIISDYDKWLKPSLDRVNSSKGYTLDNIQWTTWRDNYMRGRRLAAKRMNEILMLRRYENKKSNCS